MLLLFGEHSALLVASGLQAAPRVVLAGRGTVGEVHLRSKAYLGAVSRRSITGFTFIVEQVFLYVLWPRGKVAAVFV